MKDVIEKLIKESIEVKQSLAADASRINEVADEIIGCYKRGGKVLVCGNGGSAADAQHFVAELVGRFKKERQALCALALTTNTSCLTAIGNDYGFEKVFSRQVEAFGKKGDLLVGISTSGNSSNISEAMAVAREKGMKTVCFLGKGGGRLKGECDLSVVVKSDDTARIQESHITIIHVVCELVENALAG
ncbi:D-sedoheptulose 7-phosphate isomerase [Candidatus Woesearchaeota archaeon]|nr:D-sedoheptulose 7-phosphate isomerase [Candidatus Woesearchaeota archaeon]